MGYRSFACCLLLGSLSDSEAASVPIAQLLCFQKLPQFHCQHMIQLAVVVGHATLCGISWLAYVLIHSALNSPSRDLHWHLNRVLAPLEHLEQPGVLLLGLVAHQQQLPAHRLEEGRGIRSLCWLSFHDNHFTPTSRIRGALLSLYW